jgi:transcriptional regulator with XRE-family HTH domain
MSETSTADLASERVVLNDIAFRAGTSALGARTDRERCAVAGISKSSLHRWRAGTVVPSLRVLRRVAKRLRVPVEDLIRSQRHE